jgi:hypothetical protein
MKNLLLSSRRTMSMALCVSLTLYLFGFSIYNGNYAIALLGFIPALVIIAATRIFLKKHFTSGLALAFLFANYIFMLQFANSETAFSNHSPYHIWGWIIILLCIINASWKTLIWGYDETHNCSNKKDKYIIGGYLVSTIILYFFSMDKLASIELNLEDCHAILPVINFLYITIMDEKSVVSVFSNTTNDDNSSTISFIEDNDEDDL